MRGHVKFMLFAALGFIVVLSGCVGNGVPGGTSETTRTITSTETLTEAVTQTGSETSTGSESPKQTETNTPTSSATETATPTPSPSPNGSVQLDEDGLPICTGDMSEDSGCEDNKTIEGSGSGFALPEDIVLNITLQPVLQLAPINPPNLTYVGPLSSMADVPGEEDVIEWVGLITSSTKPGESVTLTLHFKDENLLGQYIHVPFIMDPITGKKVTYEPTVMKLSEGDEFGKRWEVHLYGGISGGSFTLYEITGNGPLKLQEGKVELKGSSASFTIENFSSIFPDKTYMSVEAVPMSSKLQAFSYPSKESFVIKAKEGRIDYYTSAFLGIEGEPVSLRATSSDYDLILEFYLTKEDWLPFTAHIDSSDDGTADWILEVRDGNYELKDSSGSLFRDGNVTVEDTQLGKRVSLRIENFYSLVPWRKFRLWMTNWVDRFPAKSNLWVDASEGMSIEKDVDRYLVAVVEDVFIKENGDYAEGEIELSSWAYGMTWPDGKVYPINHSSLYTFGYPIGHWVEAEDNSRLLYHDDRMTGSLGRPFVNGYPILAMPMEEAKKYKIIVLETAAWDRDEPGKYVTKTVGYLTDFAVGMATGEIGTVANYAYKGATWMNWLATGQSGDDLWGNVFNWLAGAEPDKVGDAVYVLHPNEADFTRGYRVVAESKDGNMRVTYVIYEVEVPRLLKYDNLKAELLEVDFTKDTEIGDDEYYYYARACAGFESLGETEGLHNVEVNVLAPAGYAYSYPVSSSEGATFNRQPCSARKIFHKYLSGDKLSLKPGLAMLERDDARVPFLYMEYSGWEEDSGKWGNDDDPMGNVGITIVFDDDYFDWDPTSGIPSKYWSLDFDVCGVSGGCSKVWFGLDVRTG
ncbi:hypothetical protein [Palaeococcus ferrophilus]|uniref:hypothetical protein n=1 Tax=Palaeococcus ferrophilus TaxID=83868 RepID=UPI00064F3E5F|nr:hypothetical protein [Palaeococcus ferrophilus]